MEEHKEGMSTGGGETESVVTGRRVGGVLFAAFSVAYGLLAQDIELYPGEEAEPFNARTLPTALAWLGAALGFLLVVLPDRRVDGAPALKSFDWVRSGLLCLLMIGYGMTIQSWGFLLATTTFLLLGFSVLGERRPLILVTVPFGIAAGFQLLLQGLLDIYLVDPFLQWVGVL